MSHRFLVGALWRRAGARTYNWNSARCEFWCYTRLRLCFIGVFGFRHEILIVAMSGWIHSANEFSLWTLRAHWAGIGKPDESDFFIGRTMAQVASGNQWAAAGDKEFRKGRTNPFRGKSAKAERSHGHEIPAKWTTPPRAFYPRRVWFSLVWGTHTRSHRILLGSKLILALVAFGARRALDQQWRQMTSERSRPGIRSLPRDGRSRPWLFPQATTCHVDREGLSARTGDLGEGVAFGIYTAVNILEKR